MSTIVMSVNAGSSSLKFQVFRMPEEEVLTQGNIERIGLEDSIFGITVNGKKLKETQHIANHGEAVKILMDKLMELKIVNDLNDIDAIGHRIVQGGSYFDHSVKVDEDVVSKVDELAALAPLHNPAALVGYRAFADALPDCVHTFVFDTAFFQTMPPENYIYPLPYEMYLTDKIRRYGAHGTSHKYLTHRLAEIQNKPIDEMNIITCHLGGGASIAAVKNGRAFKISMGFTPLGGIMMGTRCGDIDPAIIVYLFRKYHYTPDELDDVLNKKSGVLGISGISSDTRDVEAAARDGNKRAILTFDIYVSRVVETIAGYYGLMGGADAIVFTAGIGENSDFIRRNVCKRLKCIGVEFSDQRNKEMRGREGLISTDESKMKVYVIPTNEELMIARDAYKVWKHEHNVE
ncbi:acetate/propionate family kinase [Catenisphaera adipataccumulans]|jgi:acetate kinase|uniref:Acetate kinase n=1 Tax=Catenisphaera adipataccumulans TaxID=700500 RepID=A0A7W8FW65_9FIRM|nr:acetate kinase [Catenisphaera adipataccumulans]MBB5183908.1 acetate kinase [Catenisphaera adipataccumulans]